MRIRILDRILVAIAGVILVASCAGVVAQVFFGVDVIGFAARVLSPATTTRKIIIAVGAALLLLLGVYCLLILFRHRRRKDKFILQKMETGELAISLKTLETMVQKCLEQHDEIKPEGIRLENQRDGLLIRIRGTVAGGISIPLTADTLQKQIKQYVTACSGVEVKGIRIQIESSGAEAKDAPFAIEPPVNNRLTRGTEEEAEKTLKPEPAPAEHAAEPAEQRAEEEAEKQAQTEEAAAAAAMAAAEDRMKDLDLGDDDRPIHQRLFSAQEEPCIMPLPPENAGETNADSAEKTTEEATENPAGEAPEEMKGENEE